MRRIGGGNGQDFDVESGRGRFVRRLRPNHLQHAGVPCIAAPSTNTNEPSFRPEELSPRRGKPTLTGVMQTQRPVHIVGGGLSGSEAAWQLARRGVPAVLHEMRPHRATPVHKTGQFAELVCSNSFRSDDAEASAIGLLHAEMRRLHSLVMHTADLHKLPAGSALAVDRDGFAAAITAALEAEPLIDIDRAEITVPPEQWDSVIVATG